MIKTEKETGRWPLSHSMCDVVNSN
uniref:Uncharacterized protein n=1 Tax=Rhizophora mucronata TaxID=61149 RepID=A0A2P2QYZ9_RHIMU